MRCLDEAMRDFSKEQIAVSILERLLKIPLRELFVLCPHLL